jgi:uncharacterized protein
MTASLVYLAIITLAELLTSSLEEVQLGIVLHSVLLVLLILHGATTRQIILRRLYLSLALAPLVRILSLSLPLSSRPLIEWYLIIGALLFAGAFFTASVTNIGYRRMGFTLADMPRQLLIGLIGIGLGFTEYVILRPAPLIPEFNWTDFLFAAFVLMIFTGLLEEFIFRGIVQQPAVMLMGVWGIYYGAMLFAVLHIGYLSIVDFIFVFVVGVLFGYIVKWTGSLVGVTIAHGMTNITMYLIMPFLGLNLAFLNPQEQEIVPPMIVGPGSFSTQTFPGFYITATVSPTPTPLIEETPTPTPTLLAVAPATVVAPAPTQVVCGAPPASWVRYTVRSGDTLYGLSLTYGVSMAQIQTANCLQTTTLITGQVLYVPNVPTRTLVPTLPPADATPTPESTLEASATPQPEPATATSEPIPPTDLPPPPSPTP